MQPDRFIDVVEINVTAHRERPALWVRGTVYSYAALWDMAKKIAVVPEECDGPFCALVSNKSFAGYAAILGIMLAGKIYMPLSADHADAEAADRLRQSGCRLILADADSEMVALRYLRASGLGGRVVTIDPGLQPRTATIKGEILGNVPSPEADCTLFFTSGSTGKPKAILTRQSAMIAYTQAIHEAFAPGPSDRVSQLAGLAFDFSMHDVILAWTAGACLYAITAEDGIHLPTFIRTHELTIWSSVPSTLLLLDQMRQCTPGNYPSIRLALVGGEIVPPQLIKKWISAAPNQTFYNIYGPTEAAMVVTACRWADHFSHDDDIPIGWPLGKNRIKLLDEKLNEVPQGEEGQVALGGPQVADGYYDDPNRTAASFVTLPGERGIWYLTGDRARLDPAYGYRFRGRRDSQLKVRGHRLERAEAEHLLRHAAETDDVAVVGWPISEHGIVLGVAAFVNQSPLSLEEIKRRVRKIMPRFAWPARFVLGPIPRNANNKVDYPALPVILREQDKRIQLEGMNSHAELVS